jgi:hypothetical protein
MIPRPVLKVWFLDLSERSRKTHAKLAKLCELVDQIGKPRVKVVPKLVLVLRPQTESLQ